MAVSRYYKTLFVPSINGQYGFWLKEINNVANSVDEIVQMGNLIGISRTVKDKERYGANNGVMRLVGWRRASTYNWTQLVGPNEILALNFPDNWTNEDTIRLLRRRWLEDTELSFKVAAVNRERLVTHGGLTYGMWKMIGSPTDVRVAAERLNEKFSATLYQGESFALGNTPNFAADPIFADPVMEVYPSWITAPEPMPFSQIHAAPGINTYDGRNAMSEDHSYLKYVKNISHASYGSVVEFDNDTFFINVYPDVPQDERFNYLPQPWTLYVEKTPVIDKRENIFKDDDENEKAG